jgi:hypothetical protein
MFSNRLSSLVTKLRLNFLSGLSINPSYLNWMNGYYIGKVSDPEKLMIGNFDV